MVALRFDGFYRYEELSSIVKAFAEEYPQFVEIISLGKSFEGRDIWLLKVTNSETGCADDKPAFWIDANIHATEVTGTTVALNIASELLQGFGANERITTMMDACVYYIVPRVNPDGAKLALSDPPRYIRSGVRYHPWAEREEGIHEQDIDGDGRILQMRI